MDGGRQNPERAVSLDGGIGKAMVSVELSVANSHQGQMEGQTSKQAGVGGEQRQRGQSSKNIRKCKPSSPSS